MVTLQEPATPVLADLEQLAQRYAQQRTRAELGQPWRPGLLRLHKLLASLEAWLGHCPAKQRRQFLAELQPIMEDAWALQGSVQVRKAKEKEKDISAPLASVAKLNVTWVSRAAEVKVDS